MIRTAEYEKDNSVEQARALLSEGYTKLVDAYCDRIRELYQSSSSQRQNWLIGRLEKIVGQLEIEHNPPSGPFDPEIARRVREQEHISQGKLALQLQTSLKSIQRYETVGYFKGITMKEKKAGRYLEWLKERGYNPYNL